MYYVYVLYSSRIGKRYTGSTKDLTKRLEHHNLGLNRWSKRGVPWNLIYFEEYPNRSLALSREKFLKSGQGRKWLDDKLEN